MIPSGTGANAPARIPVGYETVLGANTAFKGELRSRANIRIDGQFEGTVEAEGNVLIGETAQVSATLRARQEIKVAGAVRGDVSGRKVHISRTGRVWGDIEAGSVVTEEGAFIDGKLTMTGHPASSQGFGPALPAPEVSLLHPMAEDAISGEPLEAELLDDEHHPSKSEGAN
jgi:cytoskeletal protein CcmA (bactofilin family)